MAASSTPGSPGIVQQAVDHVLSRNLERILAIPGRRFHRRFVAASRDVGATQSAVLQEILRYAAETEFGRAHDFARIGDYAAFVAAVPVHDYEALRPGIDRHGRGERDVLFPGKPLMYNQSSGTTALPKLIPVTPYNFERTIKNRGKLWLYGLARQYPGLFSGGDLSVVSPAVEGHTEDGTPFGSLSGLVYQNIPRFMQRVHTVPYSAVLIRDYQAKAYTLLRCALARDVTVILTANPSTIVNLATKADACKETLIRDIHDGTLSAEVERGIREDLTPVVRADRTRAAELERIAQRNDVFRPADYWPRLRLVHTWKHGNCGLIIPRLREWFRPETPILDFGYLASEITATDLIDPATDGSILQVQSAFYEFTPYDEGMAGGGQGRKLLAHELEVGGRYFIHVTTFSGLYRYDMNDVIEVVGWFNETPVIRFLFKGKGITSIQGEKLSEQQLIEAVRRAASETALRHDFFVGYADAERQCYRLYIELLDDRGAAGLARFGKALDAALMAVNVEYEAKRKSARLHPPEIVDAGNGFFERFRALRLAEGALEGQFKWLNLTGCRETDARLARLAGLIEEKAS